jgi:hypothetical protein
MKCNNKVCYIIYFTGSFKTKDTLREEDIELTTQVKDIERRYKDIYKAVHDLDHTYQSCKDNFALQRYGDLKAMIKGQTIIYKKGLILAC